MCSMINPGSYIWWSHILVYVGSRWIGGGPVSLETLWVCIPRCQDVFPSIVSFLASCIVLTDSKSRNFIFIEFPCLFVCFEEILVALMLYKFMLCLSTIGLMVFSWICVCVCHLIFYVDILCFSFWSLRHEKFTSIFIIKLIEEF